MPHAQELIDIRRWDTDNKKIGSQNKKIGSQLDLGFSDCAYYCFYAFGLLLYQI
jgi:hypothetical protein